MSNPIEEALKLADSIKGIIPAHRNAVGNALVILADEVRRLTLPTAVEYRDFVSKPVELVGEPIPAVPEMEAELAEPERTKRKYTRRQ